MIRTKLRFLFAPIWLINMVFQFGLFSTLLQNDKGEYNVVSLSIIVFLLATFFYLFNDVLRFKRPLFLRISGIILLFSAVIYFIFSIYFRTYFYFLILIPTLLSGLGIIKKIKE